MPFLPGTVVKLFDNVEANGGQALCSVDWIIGTLEWQDAVSGASSSSRGYARFQVPIDSRAVQSAAILNVIRIDEPTPDGAGGYTTTTWEYRITQLDDSKGPFVTVTASPIIEDAGRFQLRSVNGGVPSKLVAFDLLSPADVLSLVVLPAMTDAGMLGITLGTVDPVGLYSYSQSNVTPLGLIAWLEQQTQAECWLERVSGSAWTLNLGTRGSAAPNPVVHVGRNVTRVLDRTILVDDSFANRVEPSGVTASGETEPTHMGGALWDAGGTSGVGGRVLAIADPDGGLPPITADDQLNGTEALTANTPLTFATSGPVLSPVFDTTRRYLWWIEGGETLKGRDVESDTIVTLNLAQGGNVLAMGYDHSVDRLVIAYANLSTVLLVNPATPAIATTLTPSANAVSLSVVPEISRAYVSLNGAFTFVVNTSAGTGATWTSGPGGSGMRHLYHTAANRIVAYTPGATALSVWAAPAGVVVTASLAIGQAFAVAEDAGQSTMGIVATGALKWGTLTVSGTPAFSGFATMPAAPNIALSPDAVLSAGGRFYIVGNSGRYVVGWTGAAYTGAVGDLGSVLTLYALERGPT
ncbi:MAG TPA: hypothetical protein VN628_06925, partial [Vicinamibacterales bacterium]|nr:hypothetical protein [Vicinamibacterales bacterium]